MSDVSLNFRQSAYAQESGVFPICLITITHDDLEDPIRLSTDPTERLIETVSDIIYGTTSRGNEFYFFPCDLKLPDETDDGPRGMSISFSNVTRDYIATIRSIATPPTINVEMVMSNALDTVEMQWPEFLLTDIQYDEQTITAGMSLELLEREPFPAHSFLPSTTPGLFR